MAAGVQIENLSFSYSEEKEVLKNLSLEIQAGEKMGLIGPMGSGKSTLLLHLNGLLTGNGTVKIGDTGVDKDTLPEIRRKVGMVFQNPDDQLFNPTVEEEIAFGPLNFGYGPDEVAEKLAYALKAMRLTGLEKSVSHHLSMGERKRVALATVLALDPEVIALDEPFANLDAPMMMQLLDIINGLSATFIIVSQSLLPLLSCCDRVAIINHGRIVAVGPVKEILKDEELMRNNGLDLGYYKKICKDLF